MHRMTWKAGMIVVLLLLLAVLAPPAYAQTAPTPLELDEAGFGFAQVAALAAQEQATFTLDLTAGDRVTVDLQGESDALQVTEFAAPYGPLVMAGVPESFNYLAWAPEDGVYTITVANHGDVAAGFVLRVVVTPAPLPAQKILTMDAAGQTIPVMVGEPFQVALEVNAGDGYAWTLDAYDDAVLAETADPVTVPLGTMPGAMSQQIFTFAGVAPGTVTLAFTDARAGGVTAAETYSVTVDVLPATGEEPAPTPLSLDAGRTARATGALDPQGMASYAVDLRAGDAVRAAVTPGDTNLVLTVVGADGDPLLTDHAGASSFQQTMPVSQTYTFKVINFGDAAQAYAFDLAVRRRVVQTGDAPAPIGPYSQAIVAGPFIFTSGQLGLDPATGELADGVEAQTRQALANLTAILAAAGAGPADVVKVTVYLADIDDFTAMDAVYGEVFQDAPPALSALQAAALPRDALVMIDLVALAPGE